MTCDQVRRQLSDWIDAPTRSDDDLDGALRHHIEGCGDCRGFATRLDEVRRHLHLQPVGAAPDVAPRVRAALETQPPAPVRAALEPQRSAPTAVAAVRAQRPDRRRSLLPSAAAAFLVAAVAAASLVGLPGSRNAGATDVRALVLAGQQELSSLQAEVEIVEHGWHAHVPTRTYTGRLDYVAPERLHLAVEDRTAYPSDAWLPNDVTVVVAEDEAWSSGRAPCPAASLPACTPSDPQVQTTVGREPFDDAAPVPLDLVLPVESFLVDGAEEPVGESEVAGHDTVGVRVTAAQIAPLLDGITAHGNWRPIHPTDVATVWLDADLGLPLLVEVTAADNAERQRWAAANGLDEAPGDAVLAWRMRKVAINDTLTTDMPSPPAGGHVARRDFRDNGYDGPVPSWLPEGMEPHRTGQRGATSVASYASGRAWLTVRATNSWTGDRLFGRASPVVRRVTLPGAGTGYVPEGGDRVLIHGDGIDVEVVGSLPTGTLIRVAASLGVRGKRVPANWSEANAATLEEAAERWPGLLTLPDAAGGYIGPGVSVSSGGVVQSFSGPGDRAFILSEVADDTLGPPVDAVVLTIDVRGRQARFTPDRGTLEWVEGGRVVTLRSRTLGLSELTSIATSLESVP